MDPRLAQAITQPTHDEQAQVAKAKFDEFVGSKPTRQQLKSFMTERAKVFYVDSMGTAVPRKLRRRAYQMLAKRMQKKVLNGELE